jgi:hypothetical protein
MNRIGGAEPMDKDSSKQKSFRKPLLVGCGTIAFLVAVVLAVGVWFHRRFWRMGSCRA